MRGYQDQIFCLREIVLKFYEGNKDLFLGFVDLEKAFDSVPRTKLFSVLYDYGIRGKLLDAIRALYRNSTAMVRICGKLSKPFEVRNGVRQGCGLSPLLFIIYMDRVLKSANFNSKIKIENIEVSCLAYADDVVILAESEEALQENLIDLEGSCLEYGLKINRSYACRQEC